MNLFVFEKGSKACSVGLCFFIVFGIVFGSFALIPQQANAEGTDNTILYSFFKLGLPDTYHPGTYQETQEGWSIIDASCNYLAQPTFGMTLQSGSVGHYIRLNFDIPVESLYIIKFSGFQSRSGGVGAIIIDGQEVGQYNFSANSGAAGSVETLGYVQLTQGTHELKLSVKARGSYGDRYYYLYPTQFILEQVDAPPVLEKINVSAEKTELLAGQTVQLSVSGTMSSGDAADFTGNNVIISYSSDNMDVASVSETGLVTAVSVGKAFITATVKYGEITREAVLCITVSQEIQNEEFIYDFHKLGLETKYIGAGTYQQTQEGWDIVNASCNYAAQPFGIVLQSESLNNYINLNFQVPQTSDYLVKFMGTQSRCGGVGSIFIDGQKIGEYNFSANAKIDGPMMEIGYIRLEQGTHQLTLKSTARGSSGDRWYYLYPTEFVIEKVPCIPELSEITITADKTELMLGQTVMLVVTGKMNTGDTADLSGGNCSISFSSNNDAIATVSNDGVVTPVSTGTVDITVRVMLDGITKVASIPITISEEILGSVSLTADKTEIPAESTIQLQISGTRTDGKALDLSEAVKNFRSSDTTIAKVDENGVVTALIAGEVTITADVTLGNVTKSGNISIKVTEPVLDAVVVVSDKSQIVIGRTAKLTVTGTLDNGKPADLTADGTIITYQSDNEAVAAVNDEGTITAAGEGIVNIKAIVTAGSIVKEAVVQIKVINPSLIVNAKTRSTYYTDAKVAAARENVLKYDWAKALKDKAVVEADKYLALGDEYIWNMVTPQSIPRTMFHIQRTKAGVLGCPVCGTEINKYGSYPWKIDPVNDPWKLECPNCHTKFPTNDFGAYYKSGLDEHGIFNPELADKSLLKNTLYPEKGETWGVDDGYGWKNGNDVWTFIAYYNHWALWYQSGIIQKAIIALRDAYIYTGDMKYAHAGIILLDRIADVYPDMDISEYLWDEGFDNGVPSWHTCQGKVLNDIWETFIVTDFASAYDAFFPALKDNDASNVVPFLSDKADQYGLGVLKYSVNGIKKNIEDNILRQVLPAFKNSQIRGNQGMHQATLAMAAVVLDEEGTTQEMLDYNFKSGGLECIDGSQYPNGRHYIVTGGNILALLVNDVDHDGVGNESSPGYNSLWINQMMMVADVLDGYDRYPEADLYKNVKFRKMFQSHYPLIMIGNYIPSIGDSGGTGLPGVNLNKEMFVKAFEKFGDPVYAQVAYMLNGNSTYGIHGSVYSNDADEVADEIKTVIDTFGPMNLESNDMTGYGLATLRDGKDYTMKVGYDYNFLDMSIIKTSGKEYKRVDFPALFYRSAGAGDYITFKFTVTEADEYSICLRTLNAPLYGKYIVKIDGMQIGDEFDAYGPTVVESDLLNFGKLDLTAGEHFVTLECAGKNDSSTNYVIGLRSLVLLNKNAEEAAQMNELYGNQQRDVWMYYGRNTGHGHKDTLNLGMHAYGLNLAPDLGYPEYTGADPKRLQWINNTISHNTVVVDKGKQEDSWVGIPHHFDQSEMVSLMDVEAPDVYPQTEIYHRTTAMVKVDDANSYAIDFFRIVGGSEHHFSFHSNEAVVTTEGLNLTAQETGTYAGPDVPFGQRPANDSVDGTYYMGPGFHYLYNVEKDENPSDQISIDWQQTKDPRIHLRMTMLGALDDVAIADGDPPLNNASNPRRLKYMIAHRKGQELDSTFTSVFEPYKVERYIQSISPAVLKVDGQVVNSNDAKAVKVVLKNGRIDYIVYSLNTDVAYTVDDRFQFKGFFGVYSEKDGNQIYAYVNDGTVISQAIVDTKAEVKGTVTGFTKDMNTANEIMVLLDDENIDANILVGQYIYVENDGIRNGAYRIKGIKAQDGRNVILNIGDITLIRGWIEANNFSKGYVYDITEGTQFTIPLSTERTVGLSAVTLSSDKTVLTRAQTTALTVTGELNTGVSADLSSAVIEYISSNPEVASVENGIVMAYNCGQTQIIASVTLNGVKVQSNLLTIDVTTNAETIRSLIETYLKSGDLKGPLAPQLINSLEQSAHQLDKGSKEHAVKHMKDFLKHLNNPEMADNISKNVREILNTDVDSLIKLWME